MARRTIGWWNRVKTTLAHVVHKAWPEPPCGLEATQILFLLRNCAFAIYLDRDEGLALLTGAG